MACDYVFLDQAKMELAEAAAYLSAATGGNRAPAALLDEAEKKVDLICEFPTMHALSRIPELAEKGYRAALFGSYVMLYTLSDDVVYIEHVFHQRQDYAHLV